MTFPAIACSALLAFGQIPFPSFTVGADFLVASESAYLLGPAHAIAGPGEVSQTVWSDDGLALASVVESIPDKDQLRALKGEEVAATTTLHVHNLTKGGNATYSMDGPASQLRVRGWIAGERSLLFITVKVLPSGPNRDAPEEVYQLHRWSPGASAPQVILTAASPIQVTVSRKVPYAIAIFDADWTKPFPREAKWTAVVIRPAGTLLPVRAAEPLEDERVAEDEAGFLHSTVYNSTKIKPGQSVTLRIDTDGRTTPLPDYEARALSTNARLRVEPAVDPNGLRVGLTTTETRNGPVSKKVQSAWLWMPDKGQIRASLIAAEANSVLMSPKSQAVAYVSKQNVFVRRIQKVNAKDFEDALEALERKALMSNAKQVGLAMMIYCADYDDEFPLADNWQDTVYPYLKSKSLMDGFVYEMNGGNANKIPDPTTKRLGVIEGRFGRAIVFADSHVIWEKRKLP